MKKIIIIQMLAGSVSMPALANWNSKLSLTNFDNTKFVMYFDNSYFSTPSNTYNVTDIAPGRHHVRMLKQTVNYYGYTGMPMLLYDGYVDFPVNTYITAYASGVNQFNIVSSVPLVQNNYDPNYTYGFGSAGAGNGYDPYGNNNGYGYGNNGYGNNGYGNGGYGGNCGSSQGNNGWNNYPGSYGMTQQQFDALKSSINAQPFEGSKLTIAEQALNGNKMTAAQVEEITKLFTFESTKLDFAKYAYGKTVDRGNYYMVNNAFTFSSSIDELAQYINTYHA